MPEKFPVTHHTEQPDFDLDGQSLTGRFSNMPEPANENLYDRRKKIKKPKSDSANETKIDGLPAQLGPYSKIALSPEGGLEKAISAWKHDYTEKLLTEDTGILTMGDGVVTLHDTDKLANLSATAQRASWTIPKAISMKVGALQNKTRALVTSQDIVNFINNLVAENEEKQAKPIVTLPSSEGQAFTGVYPDCHLRPWEVATWKQNWSEPIQLDDGTWTNLVELHVADILKTRGIKRIRNGKFSLTTPGTDSVTEISGYALTKEIFPNYGSRNTTHLSNNPAEFTQQYFKNLDRLNILKASDFKKLSLNFQDDTTAPSDRHFGNSGAYSLRTPGGKSALYYIGKDTIVGTDIPVDREHMLLRYLDDRTCGIIKKNDHTEEILCTFPLLTAEEVNAKRQITKEKLERLGRPITEQHLSINTSIGAEEMKQRLRRYRISEFLPRYPNEAPEEYADRIAQLNDPRIVAHTTRDFFQQTGIGIHQLPWSEQLTASSIITDPRFQKNAIASFCKRYGIKGLRTFIASTFGANVSKDILALGEKSPELAAMTFEKFDDILNAVDASKESVQSLAKDVFDHPDQTQKVLADVSGHLLKRAKQVLEQVSSSVSQSKKITPKHLAQLSQELENIRADIVASTITFKTLHESGHVLSLEDFRDSQFTTVDGREIPSSEQQQMRTLYEDSMRGYPEATKKRLLSDFDTHLSDTNSAFHLYRYKDEVVGFLCATKGQEGKKYMSAITLDPRFQKAYIGESMIDQAFTVEAQDGILGADCVAEKSVSARYIENGFIGVRSWDDQGDLILDIIRDDQRNEQYFSSKAWSREEIIRLAPLGKAQSAHIETVTDPKQQPI